MGGERNAVQRRAPGAVRCTAPSWTSEVRTPELAASQSAQVSAVLARQAWARRLRRQTLPLWRDVLGEEFIAAMECRGLCHGIANIVVAVGTQWTPPSCSGVVLVAEVRDSVRCPVCRRLAKLCFFHYDVVESAVEDRASLRRRRLRMGAALEAAEDGHVAWLHVKRASWRDEAQHDVSPGWPLLAGSWSSLPSRSLT